MKTVICCALCLHVIFFKHYFRYRNKIMKVSIITIGLCIFYFTASSASPSPQGDSNNPCNCRFPNSEVCRNRRKEIGCSLTDTSTGKFALLFIYLSTSKQTSFLTIVIIFSSAQEQWVLELVVQVSTQLNQLLVSISECSKSLMVCAL